MEVIEEAESLEMIQNSTTKMMLSWMGAMLSQLGQVQASPYSVSTGGLSILTQNELDGEFPDFLIVPITDILSRSSK